LIRAGIGLETGEAFMKGKVLARQAFCGLLAIPVPVLLPLSPWPQSPVSLAHMLRAAFGQLLAACGLRASRLWQAIKPDLKPRADRIFPVSCLDNSDVICFTIRAFI